jgi:pimeloyl-ACP methyl ester carboxylesterase
VRLRAFADCPTRNRISACAEDVQAVLAALDVHDSTLVGHSLGGAVATPLAERLGDDAAALVLITPAGFGRIHVAEAIQLPGVRTVVRHGLPLALMNPVTALGVYMAVVGNGQLPDPELVARLRKNAHRWAPGAACANEAITASGRSRRAFYRRELEYHGPVLALWGEHDRLVPLAHRDGVMTAFPHAEVNVWKKMGHHPQRERPSELAGSSKPPAPAPVQAGATPRPALSPGLRACSRSGSRRIRYRLAWASCPTSPSPSEVVVGVGGKRPTPRGMADSRWFSPADPTVSETRLERVIRRGTGPGNSRRSPPRSHGVFAPAIG